MEGLIPFICRSIRRKKSRRYYRCLSSGAAEFEARKFLLPPPPPPPQKLGAGAGSGRKVHRRHRSMEDLSMKQQLPQDHKPQYSARSFKSGSLRVFSCIGS